MSPDIISVKDLLKQEKIWNCAKHHMEKYHTSQVLTQFLLFRGFFHIFSDLVPECGNASFQSLCLHSW